MTIQLTSHQAQAAGLAVTKLRDLRSDCRIGGYAGTGKTTLIASIVAQLSTPFRKVRIMAPTGKAANVLNQKGVPASTIHRYIYEPVDSPGPLEFRLRDTVDAAYFIIDESSMLSTELYNDIKSFGIPTLFIGDPAQLEPIGQDAKLMHSPDFTLVEIHRTAAHSPIIKWATALRTSSVHPVAYAQNTAPTLDLTFSHISDLRRSQWLAFDQIIVGKNATRNKFNQTFKLDQTQPLPVSGDKLICLRNDYSHEVFNGETFTCADSTFEECPQTGEFTIAITDSDGLTKRVPFWRDYFFDQTIEAFRKPRDLCWFDFAYAITCHKAQGSEWSSIAVVDEAFGTPPNRWRYTAATRAATSLTWIRQ